MSIQIERQKKRRKQKGKFMVRTQWGNDWKREPVEDYGTFAQMYKKYGTEKYMYWCAQMPPHRSNDGTEWLGYRLDGTETLTFKRYGNKSNWSLSRYGRHKAWISDLKVEGKRVILVANAQLESSIGATGTIIGGAVALSTAQRLLREKRRRARLRAKKAKWRTNRKTGKKYRR